MSLIQTLKRLLDPNQARFEEAEKKARREQPKRDAAGDPPTFACRICGYVASERGFCPHCLADTLEPVRKPR